MGFTWVRYCTVLVVITLLIHFPSSEDHVEAGDGDDCTASETPVDAREYILRSPESPPDVAVRRTDSYPMTPVMATGGDGRIHAVWVEGFNHDKREVRYAHSDDGGGNWSTSLAVSSNLTHRATSVDVAANDDGTLAVTWREWLGDGYFCYLRVSRDGGRSFGPTHAVKPLPGYNYCYESRVVVDPDGTAYLVIVNRMDWVLSNRDDYAIGWCQLGTDGAMSGHRVLHALGWSFDYSNVAACYRDPGKLEIAYTHNETPYLTTLSIDSGTTSTQRLPMVEGYTVQYGLVEVMRWEGATHVVLVSGTYRHRRVSWISVQDDDGGRRFADLYKEGVLLDASISRAGELLFAYNSRDEDTLYLCRQPMASMPTGSITVAFHAGDFGHDQGASIVPLEDPVNRTLMCTRLRLGEEGTPGTRYGLDCSHWDWGNMSVGNMSALGTDAEYVSDRAGLSLATGADGTVHAVWAEPRGYSPEGYSLDDYDVLYSRRRPGWKGFEPPVRLNANVTNRPVWGMLDVAVGTDGTVYVAWFCWKSEPGYGSGYRLEGTLSRDNGTTWAEPRTYVVGDEHCTIPTSMEWRHLQMEASPNGTVFLSVVQDFEAISLHVYGIYVQVAAWEDDYQFFLDKGVFGVTIYDGRHREDLRGISLQLSPSGNPHLVYEYQSESPDSNRRIDWIRSLDGGFNWEAPVTVLDRTATPVFHNGQALVVSDDVVVVASADSGAGSIPMNTSLHWCMRDLANDTTTYVEILDNVSGLRPIDGMVGVRDDGKMSTVYFLAHEGVVTPGTDLFYRTVLCSVRVAHEGTVREPQVLSRSPVRYRMLQGTPHPEYPYVSMDVSSEPDGAPVLGATMVGGAEGRLEAFVWRVNHLPRLEPVGETGGGWVFGPDPAVAVRPAADPDGDLLEYRFTVWSPDGAYNSSSGWRLSDIFSLAGLDHGEYCWSVEVRDPFGSVASGPGWWFRYDVAEPSADAGGPYVTTEGSPVLLSGEGSSDDGPIVMWEWDLDGDGVFEVGPDNTTVVFPAVDDFRGNVTLRVTDEAGRRSTDSAALVVLNSPPTCALTGHEHLAAGDTARLGLKVMDAGPLDTHTVYWYGEEGPIGTGTNVSFLLPTPGPYLVSVRVEDDDGGVCSKQYYLNVNYIPLHVEVQHPVSVWVGDEYRVYITDNYPVPLRMLNVTWYVGDAFMGTGRELWLNGDAPGEVELMVLAEDPVGHTSTDTGTVTVRERLEPVLILGPTDVSEDAIAVMWTRCDQAYAFDRYEVVISTEPLTSPPTSFTDWNLVTNPRTETWYTVHDISSTAISFSSLEPDSTYYIRVDVVGDDQRSFSNVYAVRTLAEGPGPDTVPADNEGDGGEWTVPGLLMVLMLVLVVIVTVVATAIYIRYRDAME